MRKEYVYQVIDNKTKEVLDEGTFSSYHDKYRRPSVVRPLYKSYTTCIVKEKETGVIVEDVLRKQTIADLPKYCLPRGNYEVHSSWKRMSSWIEDQMKYTGQTYDEITNPDFQRNHVWNRDQQIKYIEHCLKGGKSGRDIYFNCASWMGSTSKDSDLGDNVYCVDGLQRITAVKCFIDNEFSVFDNVYVDDLDCFHDSYTYFKMYVLDFQNKKDILQWYLDMNGAGTPHTKEELDRVRKLKENC